MLGQMSNTFGPDPAALRWYRGDKPLPQNLGGGLAGNKIG